MNRHTKINLAYAIVAILAILAFQKITLEARRVERLSYSEFREHLKAGRIRDITVYSERIARAVTTLPSAPTAG